MHGAAVPVVLDALARIHKHAHVARAQDQHVAFAQAHVLVLLRRNLHLDQRLIGTLAGRPLSSDGVSSSRAVGPITIARLSWATMPSAPGA